MKLIDYNDLKTVFGLKYSRTHIMTMVNCGKFPKPIKLGISQNKSSKGHIAWSYDDINDWLIEKFKNSKSE